MTDSATQTPVLTTSHHLLGHPGDLTGHIEAHGPLSVWRGRDVPWQQALAESLEQSGLTGRGGGGFPASIKHSVARAGGSGGTLIVNGMESEPASDKDKVLLTRSPHLVLDGAQYVAALCQASRIVVCIPQGGDGVAAMVSRALAERAASRYAWTEEMMVRPPDRFVAGEESALVNFVNHGVPRPMFRIEKGTPMRIGKHPALVHNAETLAHIALIARHGPAPFRARGLAEEPGTCLVTISGAVARPGVVEVDRGTPLWDIVAVSNPVRSPQAFLVGGYGGAWIGPEHFGTPYASIPLRTIGASAGVGIVAVLGNEACGVAESARIAQFLADQGAGQCGPCVFGLPAIADDVTRLARGEKSGDLVPRLLRRLGEVDGRGACRHPDGAVGLVRSALTTFAADVAAHERGEPCAHRHNVSSLRFPRPIAI